MIVLLNLIWILVLGASLLAAYKLRKVWPVIVGGAVLALYMQFQPSHMPKGATTRAELPPFEVSDAKIVDNLLKPKPGELYDAEREAAIKKGLPKSDD